jgi:hypothetical protein
MISVAQITMTKLLPARVVRQSATAKQQIHHNSERIDREVVALITKMRAGRSLYTKLDAG